MPSAKVELNWVELDAPIEGNSVWAKAPVELAPRFSPPFASDAEGALFRDEVWPGFGRWRGVDAEALPVRIHRYEGPANFVVELTAEARQVVIARLDAASLSEAAGAVAEAMRRGVGWWGKKRGRHLLGEHDLLRIPCLDAFTTSGRGQALRLLLEGGAEGAVPPSEQTLGRGTVYERFIQPDQPFFVWIGDGEEGPLAVLHVAELTR